MNRTVICFILALLTGTTPVMGQSESEKPKLHDVSLIYGIGPYTGRDRWERNVSNGMLSVQYVLDKGFQIIKRIRLQKQRISQLTVGYRFVL
jgi:hypothetical protein